MRVLLVGVDRAGQPVLGAARIVGLHPLAGSLCRLRGHVLAGGVARREVDSQVEQRTNVVLADVGELARARGRLGGGSDLLLVLINPGAELARLQGVVEDEHRGALHVVLDDGRLHAATFGEHAHAAVVAGDERALGGSQRHVEVSPGVLAVDPQRTGHADRHLRHTGEVLDVPRQQARDRTRSFPRARGWPRSVRAGTPGGAPPYRACSRRPCRAERAGRACDRRPYRAGRARP